MYKVYDFTVKDLIEKGIKSNDLRTYLMITGLIRVDLYLSKEQKGRFGEIIDKYPALRNFLLINGFIVDISKDKRYEEGTIFEITNKHGDKYSVMLCITECNTWSLIVIGEKDRGRGNRYSFSLKTMNPYITHEELKMLILSSDKIRKKGE